MGPMEAAGANSILKPKVSNAANDCREVGKSGRYTGELPSWDIPLPLAVLGSPNVDETKPWNEFNTMESLPAQTE